ncbi:hypothetical protein MPSEU_001101600 [Mayamaea pseudoterrestris]|nr:hypothetical protein MPSEU_001101600 [Mayamaea pseudoterrestris]
MIPNPATLINSDSKNNELPDVEQLGTITLNQLHSYHCNNPTKRIVSLYGVCYDVTSSVASYGPDGAYKEYAGHDITLAISNHKTQEEWLDRFVKMTEDQHSKSKGWVEYFGAKYRPCATLDLGDELKSFDNQESWPELSDEDKEAFSKGCIIM